MLQPAANATDPSEWAVVVPSFNHADDAIRCLATLWEARPRPGTVLLIDDASTENAVEAIADWARNCGVPHRIVDSAFLSAEHDRSAWLTIAQSKVNGGFVASCNIGLRHVRDATDASHVLLLNNDTAIDGAFFGELAKAVERHPGVGLLSGSIYEWDRTTVWYSGAWFSPIRVAARHRTDPVDGGEPRDTGYVCGCTMLISRRVLEEVGVLAECFRPCYGEDLDYSLRARAAGFPVMYAPRAVCYHRVGASLGRPSEQSPATVFSLTRNLVFTLRRNFRGWRLAAGIAYLTVKKPGRALVDLARGRPRRAQAVLSGMLVGMFSPAAHDD